MVRRAVRAISVGRSDLKQTRPPERLPRQTLLRWLLPARRGFASADRVTHSPPTWEKMGSVGPGCIPGRSSCRLISPSAWLWHQHLPTRIEWLSSRTSPTTVLKRGNIQARAIASLVTHPPPATFLASGPPSSTALPLMPRLDIATINSAPSITLKCSTRQSATRRSRHSSTWFQSRTFQCHWIVVSVRILPPIVPIAIGPVACARTLMRDMKHP